MSFIFVTSLDTSLLALVYTVPKNEEMGELRGDPIKVIDRNGISVRREPKQKAKRRGLIML